MLVPLGPRRITGEVVDLLLDCHGRIRQFTTLARRLATARAAPPAEIARTAASIRRYFVEALPLHVEDEELDLEPRLAGQDPRLDRALATMRAEHGDHGPALARLVAMCEALERDPGHLLLVGPDLAAVSAGLEARLAAHLDLEERAIFPAVRRLPAPVQREILEAMRARRAPL
jgi:hemerythrin-like domain-containing protein